MIAQFNSISNWVASEILKKKSVKDRAVILNRFIIIAEESRAMRNFNSVMAILSGLQSTPIYRLQKTWNVNIIFFIKKVKIDFQLDSKNIFKILAFTRVILGYMG